MKRAILMFIFPFFLSANSYSHHISEVEERKFAGELFVLTFNVCALPGALPKCFGGMPPVDMRKEGILEVIHEQDADIVCLQEVWDPYFRKFLIDELREEYPHIFYKIGPSCWGMDSGLFIAAKYPVTDTLYIPFDNNGSLPDRVIHRGIFTFKIGDHKIGVTHLQPGDTKKEIRKAQVAQIPEDCEILIGDLNTQGDEEFEELFGGLYHKNFNDITHEEKQKTQDYILTKENLVERIEAIQTSYSDHFALSAEISFVSPAA